MLTTTQTVPISTAATSHPVELLQRKPLKLSGALDSYKHFDVTPIIGREYSDASLREWLQAPNSDELIRDLAITSTFWLEQTATPTLICETLADN